MAKHTQHSEWCAVLHEQGRTLRWLAIKTGKAPRTVYAYSQGQLVPTPEWLAAASRALGKDVAA
jgi:hypothetical protein